MPRKYKRKKGEPRLSLKEKEYARNYVDNGGNQTLAYKEAYGVPYDSANASSTAVHNRPRVQAEIERILSEEGITKSQTMSWLRESIEKGIGNDARNSDALRGIDMLLKLYNMYPGLKHTVEKKETVLNLHAKSDKELQGILEQQMEKLQKINEMERELEGKLEAAKEKEPVIEEGETVDD